MSIMRTLLNIIIILCVLLNWGCTEGARKISSGKGCSQTIKVSSLFHSSSSLPSSCSLSSKASNTKSSLQLVHRHGPCSHLISGKATTSLDHDDILKRDKARVDSIHSKLTPSQLTDLPAERWGSNTLGSGTYIVKIGIGTPKHDMSLLFDTGSDLTWVQCKPCTVNCYTQKEPIFNPSSSSSYHNVSCSSPVSEVVQIPLAATVSATAILRLPKDLSPRKSLPSRAPMSSTALILDAVRTIREITTKVSPDFSGLAPANSPFRRRQRRLTIKSSPTASLLPLATPVVISPLDQPESPNQSNSRRFLPPQPKTSITLIS
ncbi:Xylanase inhibitor N-terminal [Arabidopsis suecica]|uniref:Xylanase inhibitor N-terminal n=1 Tax=Arabidopsis suecica TaxID=45249 RepID=A0A8T1Z958_ARASU|nr:Xylanase inhibitor N-terminal [Arabidopsis suecica]